jgi:hypothetical protein
MMLWRARRQTRRGEDWRKGGGQNGTSIRARRLRVRVQEVRQEEKASFSGCDPDVSSSGPKRVGEVR